MNWKKITLMSGIALATIALSLPSAQAAPRGGGSARQPAAFARGTAGLHSGSGRANWNNGNGRGDWNNGNGRWSNNGHWHHHHYYPRYYYTGLYPFGFGYPFGYGYGFGYGYPYYGNSASLYYDGGYNPGDRGRNGNVAVNVQRELARQGYYRGSIDGVIGDRTRRAIRAYERANGLPVDGQIDRQMLETMGLS